MDAVLAQAIKDLLHNLVDNEEPKLVADLLSKLPAAYAAVAVPLSAALMPPIVAAQDALIEKL